MSNNRAALFLLPVLLCGAARAQTTTAVPIPGPTQVATPGLAKRWAQYGRDQGHNAGSLGATQTLNQIHWSTPVDLNPQYTGTALLIHYGSPVATNKTIVLPLKTGATGGFDVEGRRNTDGALVWSETTDYIWPPHNWGPSMGICLTPSNTVAIPAAGGTILVRSSGDLASATLTRLAFYGLANYNAAQATYDANVYIDTPITVDAQGNLYFGFATFGATPAGLAGGIARIDANGNGSWVSAATAAADGSIQKVSYNSALALSRDGQSLYVAVNDVVGTGFGFGYLLRLNAQTLALQSKVRLKDWVFTSNDAYMPDDGSASPMVGPDGDVYFGVLENPFYSNDVRGWLLHFSGDLSQQKTPGAFGWDTTPSIVPASAVPSYGGSSSYLLLTKYNHYAGVGSGDGVNKLAVLDPNTMMVDPVSGANVMDEVLIIAGPTPDAGAIANGYPNAVREWCINTAAIDLLKKSALVNCEDGILYRWDFATNTLTESVVLTAGLGEAYTPTMVGPDGTVYAINNALLFAVGR